MKLSEKARERQRQLELLRAGKIPLNKKQRRKLERFKSIALDQLRRKFAFRKGQRPTRNGEWSGTLGKHNQTFIARVPVSRYIDKQQEGKPGQSR